jgi:DNA-binding MarR family transcriptional regulator
MDQPTKLEQQLCFEVYKASSNFSKLYAKTLEPFGLTFTQYLVLLVLWEEDGLTMKQIGEQLGLGTGTLNPIINRMIENGRVTKEQSTEDRRAFRISLTDQSRADEKPIEQAIYSKITSCNYLDVNAIVLMKNLKALNAFFSDMDL